MLVRFAERGIDLTNSSYLNDTLVFPGFAKELQNNLTLQKRGSGNGFVSTDIYANTTRKDVDNGFICSVFRPDKENVWHDGQKMELSDSRSGLYATFNFDKYTDNEKHKEFNEAMDRHIASFKEITAFPLFVYHHGFYTDFHGEKRENITYAIDFGKDIESATRIISDIIIHVFGLTPTDKLSFYTNYGKYEENPSRPKSIGHKITKFLKSPGFYIIAAIIILWLLWYLEIL